MSNLVFHGSERLTCRKGNFLSVREEREEEDPILHTISIFFYTIWNTTAEQQSSLFLLNFHLWEQSHSQKHCQNMGGKGRSGKGKHSKCQQSKIGLLWMHCFNKEYDKNANLASKSEIHKYFS